MQPARDREPTGSARLPFALLMRVPVPWVFVLGYLVGVGFERVWPLRLGAGVGAGVTLALGVVVFTAGAVVAGWGLVTFRRARTTTVPGRASSRLVTWGPYRFGRNPMYVGLSVAYVGEAFLLRQVWPVLVLPLVLAYVNWVVIPVEERKLEEVFGGEYAQYRRRVRRWL
jgi:protein-S-isoprenylcysteine O-methyltransferase Ste14